MTREIPTHLAPVIEELELNQAFLVNMEDLRLIAKERSIDTGAALIAKRLRDRGWLLKTEWEGIWEFSPGAHAGAVSRGHPFRDILVARLAEPYLNLAVCLSSALWAHGLGDRLPERPEVAVPVGARTSEPLTRACRVVRFDHRLSLELIRDAPVHKLTTVLVHLAAKPTQVRSWGALLDSLGDLVAAVMDEEASEPGGLDRELEGRPAAVRTRLAYLVHGVAPSLADELDVASHGKVWFGRRGPLKRHNARFEVADTILPMSPGDLPRVR